MPLMPLTIAAVLVLTLTSHTANAQARLSNGGLRDIVSRPIDPRAAERLRARMHHLVDLPDGSYIAQVNGRGAPVTLRNGMTLVISGKGFDQRRALSIVGLFPQAAGSTGAQLKILDWSDTRITVVVPADQTWLTADSDTARLVVQAVRANGIEQRLVIPNVHFRAR
ncbi:hypothetical protein [Sphingomonas sp. UNC305MFCol5.2]|uniref:hypothetical protein n=1 Tax=Sphingomonas sp. UNC305MFCol5.2 TaxID=1449076 RepID=UPI0004A75709|nr:hypothetical protein [Sphingomonas sp. UNC305MFCol5.2]